jgi:hypothetical protein
MRRGAKPAKAQVEAKPPVLRLRPRPETRTLNVPTLPVLGRRGRL